MSIAWLKSSMTISIQVKLGAVVDINSDDRKKVYERYTKFKHISYLFLCRKRICAIKFILLFAWKYLAFPFILFSFIPYILRNIIYIINIEVIDPKKTFFPEIFFI
jgi:hypothetical protein